MIWKRAVIVIAAAVILAAAGDDAEAQLVPGFSTEPLLPVGDYAKAVEIGWGITGYLARRIGGRKGTWAITADIGAQWHAGDTVDPDDHPEIFPPDSTGDGDELSVTGWMFPARLSFTKVFGRTYVMPRGGIYIPVGDLDSILQLDPSFGFSPRVGYLFPVTRELTADVAIEYTIVFDRVNVMYFGFGFGFLMGGGRLPHQRLPY